MQNSKSMSAWERRRAYSNKLNERQRIQLTDKSPKKTITNNEIPTTPLGTLKKRLRSSEKSTSSNDKEASVEYPVQPKRRRTNSFTISLDKTLDEITRPDLNPEVLMSTKKIRLDKSVAKKRLSKEQPLNPRATKKPKISNLNPVLEQIQAWKIKRQPKQKYETNSHHPILKSQPKSSVQGKATAPTSNVRIVVQNPEAKQNVTTSKNGVQRRNSRYVVPSRIESGIQKKINEKKMVSKIKNPTVCKPPVVNTINFSDPQPSTSGVMPKLAKQGSFTIDDKETSGNRKSSVSFFHPTESSKKKSIIVATRKLRTSAAMIPGSASFKHNAVSQSSSKANAKARVERNISSVSSEDDVFLDAVQANEDLMPITPSAGRNIPKRSKSVSFKVPFLAVDKPTPRVMRKTPKKDLSIRSKLENWLDQSGYSTSKIRHLRCFGHHLSDLKRKRSVTSSKTTETGASPELKDIPKNTKNAASSPLIQMTENELLKALIDLKNLLLKDHPAEDNLIWFNEIETYYPCVTKMAMYWDLRALIAEKMESTEAALEIFNQALDFDVEPTEDLQNAVSDFLARSSLVKTGASVETLHCDDKENEVLATPEIRSSKRVAKAISIGKRMKSTDTLVEAKNLFESTLIQYSLSKKHTVVNNFLKEFNIDMPKFSAVVTPVRRSSRLLACTPKAFEITDVPKNKRSQVLTISNDFIQNT